MSTYDEADHPRGGNPSNSGQWTTKPRNEAASGTLTSDQRHYDERDVQHLAGVYDLNDVNDVRANAATAHANAERIRGRGYVAALENVVNFDPSKIVDGELDPESTDSYVEVHAFTSESDLDDWLNRGGFHSDVEAVEEPDINYAAEAYQDPKTGMIENRGVETFLPDKAIDDDIRSDFAATQIETALWSTVDDHGEPLERRYNPDDLDPEAQQSIHEDLDDFVDENNPLLEALRTEHPDYDLSQLPHDFWLSRNGHGAGFSDRGLGDIGDTLQERARVYGVVDLAPGDDRRLHL